MQTNKDMSNYRLEKAGESLDAAKTLIGAEKYANAASCSYYCVFHSIRSVLALENVDFKKHSAVIAYFVKNYIKTGKLDKRLSDIIKVLFRLRGKSDYDDFFIIEKKDVIEQIKNAEYFFVRIKTYLDKQN